MQVDFEASHEMHRTVVKPGVELELDTLKKNYEGMDDMLNMTTSLVARTMPDEYADIDVSVIFFPQIGFLICLPFDGDTGLAVYDGSAGIETPWDRIFSTPERVYFKDCRMRDLDDTWGDVYAQICGVSCWKGRLRITADSPFHVERPRNRDCVQLGPAGPRS